MGVKNIRITYKRRSCYRTKSNKVVAVKTPGGVLAGRYLAKKASVPKCAECKCNLHGIPALRAPKMKNLQKRKKHVSRSYGGNRCANCVRDRIVRAFLIEEQKIVKKVVAQRRVKAKK